MRELKSICDRLSSARGGEKFALATVVRVDGSSYRRPGARMLICSDGTTTGMISGGCIEADVRERGLRTLQTGRAELFLYKSAPDDSVFGYGTGCNGTIEVYIAAVGSKAVELDAFGSRIESPAIAFLHAFARRKCAAAMATVVRTDAGSPLQTESSLVVTSRLETVGSLGDRETDFLVAEELRRLLGTDASSCVERELPGSSAALYFESRRPPVHLVVSGCGADAEPLASLAVQLGWDVSLFDRRPGWAIASRFDPDAAVRCAEPGAVSEIVAKSDRVAVIVMNHNYDVDKAVLMELTGLSADYIGVLGPASRTHRMLREIEEEGKPIPERLRRALYAPIGLDIGAEGPEQVALAIVAEIQAALAGRCGGMLRYSDAAKALHRRVRDIDADADDRR